MEEGNFGADGFDDAGAIVAENLGLGVAALGAHADLGVDGIDGDGADGDEEIAVSRGGREGFEIEERFGIGWR
jgi:hypothetical protein